MRDIYYEELRRNCAESATPTKEQYNKVSKAIKNILIFHRLARKEGILWLEEACKSLDKETEEKYLEELLMLVVDGTDQELVKEYALSRYFGACLTGYEGIIYLIYFKGVMMIQTDVHPEMAEKILEAMLPEEIRKLYLAKKKEEVENTKKSEQEDLQNKIESFCSKSPEKNKNEYSFLSEESLIIESVSDQDIQRILKEVDCNELAVVMRELSGNACRRIFDNMSKKVAAIIVEEIESIEAVRMSDVKESAIKILKVMLELAKAGEINASLIELEGI